MGQTQSRRAPPAQGNKRIFTMSGHRGVFCEKFMHSNQGSGSAGGVPREGCTAVMYEI